MCVGTRSSLTSLEWTLARATTSTSSNLELQHHKDTRRTDTNIAFYSGTMAAGFGVAAGTFAIMFFDAVPKVKEDILKKVPFLASFYTTEIAPEDNPF